MVSSRKEKIESLERLSRNQWAGRKDNIYEEKGRNKGEITLIILERREGRLFIY
jgi:hypothetical protein